MAIVLANMAFPKKECFRQKNEIGFWLIENHFIGELCKRSVPFHNRWLENFQRGIKFKIDDLEKRIKN